MGSDPELLEEFVAEADEHLATIEDVVLALERAGAEAPADTVNELFRALHTVKGDAGLLDLGHITELAHALEHVVGLVRGGELIVAGPVTDALLRGIDKLKAMLKAPTSDNVAYDEELSVLQQAASAQAGAEAEPEAADVELAEPSEHDSVWEKTEGTGAAVREGAPREAGEQTVRISLALLDRLMDLASELVLVRNQNVQAMAARDVEQLSVISQRLNVVTSELQASVMRTRMRAVGSTFTKFKRLVRDMARKLGKEIQLEIVGSDVELDKNIIEAITDPLVHLVRNAVDHGIESPNERRIRGKEPTGHVCLSAYHQAGQVNIRIRDDGSGMDPGKLKAAAVRKGTLREEQAAALQPREAFNLIFEPGFSTAPQVSGISGRGVGMDVVKASLQKLGGTIDVASTVGKGTTITIKLPLTLAIIPTFIVSVGGNHFAIPQINIAEVVWLYGEDQFREIKVVDNQEVYWLRGKLLPILRLASILGIDEEQAIPESANEEQGDGNAAEQHCAYIMVLQLGNEQFGLLVDRIVDTEEIVVKALHDQLKDCGTFAGTTVLGDGSIAMILDIAAVAEIGRLHFAKIESTAPAARSPAVDGRQTVLLFDLGGSERFAVPLCLIARVEEVPRRNVQTAHGREYLNFRGSLIPVIRLEQAIGSVTAQYGDDVVYVIIPDCRRPFGILAANIVDTTEVDSDLDSQTIRQTGVVGSQLIGGRLTLFLDAFAAIQALEPDWFDTHDKEETKHILLVDDSAFYRAVISFFLKSSGVEVTAVEDGSAGLSALAAGEFNGVVSDLEMPVMDGYEFARRVRSKTAYRSLPLLAVSAAEGQAAELALDAGFDEFSSKADRRGTLEAIMRLCAERRT